MGSEYIYPRGYATGVRIKRVHFSLYVTQTLTRELRIPTTVAVHSDLDRALAYVRKHW